MYDYYQYYAQPQTDYYSGINSYLNLGAVLFAVCFLLAIAAVGLFVLKGFALYRLAEKRGMENSFMAFIPFANIYFLGKIADDIDATMNKKSDFALKLTVLLSTGMLLGAVSFPFCLVFSALETYVMMSLSFIFCMIGCIVLVCYVVYYFVALNIIFKEYTPSNSTLCLVLSIILGIAPIILFALRENESGYSKWKKAQQYKYTAYDMPIAKNDQECDEPSSLEALENEELTEQSSDDTAEENNIADEQ